MDGNQPPEWVKDFDLRHHLWVYFGVPFSDFKPSDIPRFIDWVNGHKEKDKRKNG